MSKHKDKDKERSRDDRHSRDRERSRDRDHRRRSRDRSKERSRRKKSKDRSRRSRSRKSSRRDRSRSKDRSRRSRSRGHRRSYSRERERDRRRSNTPPPPLLPQSSFLAASAAAAAAQSRIDISAVQQAQITSFLSASLSGLTHPSSALHSITQPPIIQQDSLRTDFSNLFQSSSAPAATVAAPAPAPNNAALAIAAAKAKDLLRAKNLTDNLKVTNNGDSVASNGNESCHDDGGLGSADNSNSATGDASNSQNERRRKKKSRWATSNEGEGGKTFIPGMPTILPSNLNPDQQEAYLVQLQIEEISRKLRTGDLGVPANPEERSPSPEPIYSSDGKRLNTREFRTRKKLEEQRHMLITRMQCMNPDFKPPADYKPPVTRVSDKVLIPQEEHPDINFVGLLIGPRGNTLKAMEKETGAKIIIRGKGSVKEGKVGRKDGQPLPGEDEPLHAFITASNPESVKKAVDKIKEVIKQGIEVPEGSNDLRRMQLRELAQLNGTLRETDGPRCTNCGSTDHKSFLCPDKPNVTNNIVCSACGGAGHISKDCKSKRPGLGGIEGSNNQAKIDEEYLSLMAELGEVPPQQEAPPPQKEPVQPTPRPYNIFDNNRHQPKAILPPPSQNNSNSNNNNSNSMNSNNNNPNNIPPLMNTPPPPWHQNQHAPPLPAHPMGQYPHNPPLPAPPLPVHPMGQWPPIPNQMGNMNRPPPNFAMSPPGIPPPPPGCSDLAPPGTVPFGGFDDDRFGKPGKAQYPQPPLPAPPPHPLGQYPHNPPLPSFLPPPPPPE